MFGDSLGLLHCINGDRMISISHGQHEGAVRSICYIAHGGFISGAEDNTGIASCRLQINELILAIISKSLVPFKSSKHIIIILFKQAIVLLLYAPTQVNHTLLHMQLQVQNMQIITVNYNLFFEGFTCR